MIDFKSKRISNTAVVVEVSGQLTELNRKYFFDCVADMIDSGFRQVVIDCHRLGHLNSSGLAALLTARTRASRRGATIYLTHLNSNVAEILELTKLGRILSLFPTNEDAISSFQGELTSVG